MAANVSVAPVAAAAATSGSLGWIQLDYSDSAAELTIASLAACWFARLIIALLLAIKSARQKLRDR